MDKKWINCKTVIITGASSGFGKLLAEKLIKRHNCKVIGIGRTESKLVAAQQALGENFSYKAFDVGNEENWILFAEYLKNAKICPDVLINNAGVLPHFCKFEKTDANSAIKTFATNFFASVYSAKHILPQIKKSDCPTFINVSSSAVLAEVIGTAIYSASKSALASFTKILALENPDVYVGLILPGFSSTDIFREQNISQKEYRLIYKLCTPPDKMTEKMLKAIIRRKKISVIGKDSKAMSFFGKLCPQTTNKLIAKILKGANMDIFSDVFD